MTAITDTSLALAAASANSEGPQASIQMIALGLIVLAAHLGGKLGRRFKISEVTGQLAGGALVGPYVLTLMGVLPSEFIEEYKAAVHAFHFMVFVFLSLVAFGIGEELFIVRLKKVGIAGLVISIAQAITTFIIVGGGLYLLGMQRSDAFLMGTIAIATAPAVSFVLMNQLRIEGRLRSLLGSVVVLADLIQVLFFSLMLQYITLMADPDGKSGVLFPVIGDIVKALVIAAIIYFLLRVLVRRTALSLDDEDSWDDDEEEEKPFLTNMLSERPSPSIEVFLLVLSSVSVGAGIAYYFHLPFLVTAVAAGFMVSNFHSHAIFDSLKLDHLAPAFNLVFFALIGANIPLAEIHSKQVIFIIAYIVLRMIGKMSGTWIGCKIMGEGRKISACMPLLMLPHAGVAAVEAGYAATVLNHPEFAAIVLPAIVFFEVTGVLLADRTLRVWRSWVTGEEEALKGGPKAPGSVAEAAERLLQSLTIERIDLNLPGRTRGEILEALVDRAAATTEQHFDRDQALQMLAERERLAPTGLGNGVAIPHTRLMGLERSILVLGRIPEGMDFGGPSRRECDLFLLMLVSHRHPAEHLQLLSAVGRVMGDSHLREALRHAIDPDSVMSILETAAAGDESQPPPAGAWSLNT